MRSNENGTLPGGPICQAVLNALESRAAILDHHGVIVAVNEAWSSFSDQSFGTANQHDSPGGNYITAFPFFLNGEAETAQKRVRDLLEGRSGAFVLEYACALVVEPSWYQMRITPLSAGDFRGALVVHSPLTEFKRPDLGTGSPNHSDAPSPRSSSDVLFLLAVENSDRFRFVSVNAPFLQVTGLNESQVVGRLVDEIIPEPSLSLVLEKYREAVKELRTIAWDETTPYPAGLRHGQVLITPISGPDGTCTHLSGSVRDVTGQREAERALRESEERFRQLAENISEVFWIADAKFTRVLYVSPAYEEIWGQTCESLYRDPQSFLESIHPDDRPRVIAALTTNRNRGLYCEEYRVVRPDGSTRWIRDRAFPIPDSSGEIYRVVGIAEDLTERRIVEERFRALVENSHEAFVLSDSKSVIKYASPSVTRILGFTAEEMIGYPGVSFVHPEDLQLAKAHLARVRAEPQLQCEIELRVRHKAGDWRWIQASDVNRLSDPRLGAIVSNFRDVTERRQASDAFRKLSNFRETIIQTATEGICAWSCGTPSAGERVSVWNQRMVEITGYTRDEINAIGGPQTLFSSNSQAPAAARDCLVQIGNCVDVCNSMCELIRKDGQRRTVSLSISCLPSLEDQPDESTCVALVHDITDQTRAEDALRLSQSKYIDLLNTIDGIVWEADARTFQFLFVSQQAERMLGYPVSDWTNDPEFWVKHVHPDDRDFALNYCMTATKLCRSHAFTYRMIAADGREVWLHDVVTVIARDNRPELLRGVLVDVTQRVLAETALEQQRLRLNGIINAAGDGIISLDAQQQIVVFNSAAEAIFRASAESAIGQTIERFIARRSRTAFAKAFREYSRTGTKTRGLLESEIIHGLRSDGEEFPLDASVSQIDLNEGPLFTITCRDGTERLHAVESRQRLEAQLRQSQKMDAVGQLAGGIAHDFNNLLTVILAYSDLARAKLQPDSSLIPAVAAIYEAGERAAALTRQLLAFSRKAVLNPRVVDINSVVSDTEKMLSRLIGEDIRLTVRLTSEIQPVMVDPGQLSQVLINLAVNARDAMPQGGTLTISTASTKLDGPTSTPELLPGSYVLISISDTGFGMSSEILTHLFEPFFTTKGVGKGAGLGLAVVHGIIRQSGGHIEPESVPGVGTTFRIYLPAVVESPQTAGPATAAEENYRGTETILLVEDEDSVRDLARIVLQSYGYRVLTAPDGLSGLAIAQSFAEPIDLLVTDVVMPHLGGRELAEKLRVARPAMQVLYLSGYTDDAVVRHGIRQDGVAFLHKPFDGKRLGAKVREVLQQGSSTN